VIARQIVSGAVDRDAVFQHPLFQLSQSIFTPLVGVCN
jgi:hypothetical protein